jgi:ABC-type Fe3+-hydroxamate transport system substrate-binding protein
MPIYVDQMGRSLELKKAPQRIISLVPSQTELLLDLGLEDRILGRTRFCIHPKDKVAGITKIGGTKTADPSRVAALQPDLIIGNKEENEQSNIEALSRIAPVWMSDIRNLNEALQMITMLGQVLQVDQAAHDLANGITHRFEKLESDQTQPVSALYLIWYQPWMAAGQGTFIDSMLPYAGFQNVLQRDRYPILTAEELCRLKPETVLLSSEPFPFRSKHVEELQKLLPESRILLVDGECFSWYGSRLLLAADYFEYLKKEQQGIVL